MKHLTAPPKRLLHYLTALLLLTSCAPYIVTNVTHHNKGCTYIISNQKESRYVDDKNCSYKVGERVKR